MKNIKKSIAVILAVVALIFAFPLNTNAFFLKPAASGMSTSLSSKSIKSNQTLTVKVTLSIAALSDRVSVKVGTLTKTLTPTANKSRISQTATFTFTGEELVKKNGLDARNLKVTVTATNAAGSTTKTLSTVKLTPAFVKPLKAVNGGKTNIVTQGFGSNAYNKKRDHLGVDYSGSASNVVAITDGVVVDIYKGYGYGYGYGETVVLMHRVNNKTVYSLSGHMKKNSVKLKIGDVVIAGQVLGRMGSTGESTGDHTHVGVFTTKTFKPGKTIPAGYFNGNFASSTTKTVGSITYYSAVEFIKTAGKVIK